MAIEGVAACSVPWKLHFFVCFVCFVCFVVASLSAALTGWNELPVALGVGN